MTSPPDQSSENAETFIARWQGQEGGQERANYALFLSEFCDVLDVPRPDQASFEATTNAYAFERAVTFRELDGLPCGLPACRLTQRFRGRQCGRAPPL